jgi:hypothetical protein
MALTTLAAGGLSAGGPCAAKLSAKAVGLALVGFDPL